MNEVAVVVYRSVVAFLSLFVFARVLGKQQVGQLTFFEYATGITIGSIASSMSVDLEAAALPYWIGLAMWFLLTFIFQLLALKSRLARNVIIGKPVQLVKDGKILEKNMATLRYPVQDLLLQLRAKNAFDISQVENVVLETNGSLSVQFKSQHRPLTPKDMGVPTEYEGLTLEVIQEGRLDKEKLSEYNVSEQWLREELARQGIKNPKEVFLAAVNSQGEVYVAPYQDSSADEDIAQNKKESRQ